MLKKILFVALAMAPVISHAELPSLDDAGYQESSEQVSKDAIWLESQVKGQDKPVSLSYALKALKPRNLTVIVTTDVNLANQVTWNAGIAKGALNEVMAMSRLKYSIPGDGSFLIEKDIDAEVAYLQQLAQQEAELKAESMKLESNEHVVILPEPLAP